MFTLTVSDNIVILSFSNENMEIRCSPENPDRLNSNSYKADTCDGHFEFVFDDSKITFRAAKYDYGGKEDLLVLS